MSKALKNMVFILVAVAVSSVVAAGDKSPDPLDRLTIDDTGVMIEFHGVSIAMPLEALAAAGRFRVELGAGVADVKVDVDYGSVKTEKSKKMEPIMISAALRRLADEYGLVYTVPAHDQLIVDLRDDRQEPEKAPGSGKPGAGK